MIHRGTIKHPNELFGTTEGSQSRAFLLDKVAFSRLSSWLIRDLRSDHAGEVGAVALYRGILAVSRCKDVHTFASEHLKTESNHLKLLEGIVPASGRSMSLPLWNFAGYITGALPALFGSEAVFQTIDAVETFVDDHYKKQVIRLNHYHRHMRISNILERCRLDEVQHRDEARNHAAGASNVFLKIWCKLVTFGSSVAVTIARAI